jgi:O-acetyl-ADP-ribose deacetylase (regulator of RNase III)
MIRLGNGIIVETMCEDISVFYGDGIIVPNNTSLNLESPLMSRLRRKAGSSTLQAATAKGPIPLGEAVITSGGGLLSLYLVHVALFSTAGPPACSEQGKRSLLHSAVVNGLLRCTEVELESVGIPNLGVFLGYSLEESSRLLVEAIARVEVPDGNALKKVFCVSEDEEECHTFSRIASAVSV